MRNHRKKFRVSQWFVRKVAYAVCAVVVAVLAVAGVLSEARADQILGSVDTVTALVMGVIGASGLGVASAKTHSGSDSTVTATDINRAVEAAISAVTSNVHMDSKYGSGVALPSPEVSPPPVTSSVGDLSDVEQGRAYAALNDLSRVM